MNAKNKVLNEHTYEKRFIKIFNKVLMKTYLKFSAVLPIYKKVNFKIFVRSLESILKQSYQPDEF